MKADKRFAARLVSCLAACVLLAASFCTAVFADAYDPDQTVALNIQLQDLGTPMDGVAFECYQVGQMTDGTAVVWELVPALQGHVSVELSGDLTASELQQAARTLKTAVSEQNLTCFKGSTDNTGAVSFTGLPQGVYLLVQTDTARYGICDPFLVAVPYTEDGTTWQYTLSVTAKGVHLPEPSASPEPTPTPTPGALPQTGDESNPGLWVALLCIAAVALVVLVVVKKFNKRK